MHLIAVVAFDGVVPFDLATPCEVFGRTHLADGREAYRVRVCGTKRVVDAGPFALQCRYGLAELSGADTVLVPGISDIDRPLPAALLDALRAARARGARIVSICTGAFLLAAAGLLAGKRATTHWLAAPELAPPLPAPIASFTF